MKASPRVPWITAPLCRKSKKARPRPLFSAGIIPKPPRSSPRCAKREWTPSSSPTTASKTTPSSKWQKYAEGVYATGPMDVSSNPMAIAAIEAHKKAYGEDPGCFFLNAYAAALALLNAIEQAGSTDYAAVTNALRTKDGCPHRWAKSVSTNAVMPSASASPCTRSKRCSTSN
jgi:hypothetical protein